MLTNVIERILVNCAGIAPGKRTVSKKRETGELIPHDLASFRRAVEINLIGTYAMISKCAAAMAGLNPVTPDGGRGVQRGMDVGAPSHLRRDRSTGFGPGSSRSASAPVTKA